MTNKNEEEPEAWTPVASFIPNAADIEEVQTALNQAGIEFGMEGSRAYQILVKPGDIQKAIDALKKSKLADKITIYPE